MVDISFGRRILGHPPSSVLSLEQEFGAQIPFPVIDTVTSRITLASLSGERVAVVRRGKDLELPLLKADDRTQITQVFALTAQQERGAWFLPSEGAVRQGNANLPYHFMQNARFASGVARDESEKVSFIRSPEALYFWAVLDPLFESLFKPFELRGPVPIKGDQAEHQQAWQDVDATYLALGIDATDALSVVRFGSGWSRLRSAEQLVAKQALLDRIRSTVNEDIGARFRVWKSDALVRRHYEKAKRGQPLMRQVLTKALQRVLSAFFGGDWLAFLRYLGEVPHPEEQIAVALPEPRLYVDASTHATAVAARHGISPEEIDRILAAFWTSETAESPVHQRVHVLKEFWKAFDALHGNQTSGMRSLWGLVEDMEFVSLLHPGEELERSGDYCPELYQALLAPNLLAQIAELWGGVFMPNYPDRIVSAINPYVRMCETFGPALRFWHGVSLTAWFLSEGPSSRTDMDGLSAYYEKDLAALAASGCPIDDAFCRDLISLERTLGPPTPIEGERRGIGGTGPSGGITLTFTTFSGQKLGGFERFREVVTRNRLAWTERYLEQYLRARWEQELRDAAREFSQLFEVKRKAPTAKQFAKYAETGANHWFGGDLSQLYRALGEKCPVEPVRKRYLKVPARDFAARVFAAIGGRPTRWNDLEATIVGDDREKQDAEWQKHQSRENLARLSIRYVQLREALDRPPTLKELGEGKFVYLASALDPDLGRRWAENLLLKTAPTENEATRLRAADAGTAWERYTAAIENCLTTFSNTATLPEQ